MANPFKRLIEPRWPAQAIGLDRDGAAVIALERRRDAFAVRRAAHTTLPEELVRPSFDERNIANPDELADTLAELVTSAGLLRKARWSAALPEASARTSVLTLESAPASRGETEEMLRWKIERAFGASLADLRVARRRLRPDASGRERYLATAMSLSVLAEYEEVFASLGWRVGLILPRHMGEAWWLMRDGARADSLLVSSHAEGFTAMLIRNAEPLVVRSTVCDDDEDRSDELYRFLLFYRDRIAASPENGGETDVIERLMVVGDGLDENAASAIVEETLAAKPRTLGASDVRIALPAASEVDFNMIAAPAGLAALAWE